MAGAIVKRFQGAARTRRRPGLGALALLALFAAMLPGQPAVGQTSPTAPQQAGPQQPRSQQPGPQQPGPQQPAAPAKPAEEAPAPPASPSVDEAARISAEARARLLASARVVFDREKVRLAEIETVLARRNHTGAQLDDLRSQLATSTAALQGALGPLTQRANAAKALLDQLGPKPDEKKDGPETAEAAAERENRQHNYSEISDTARIGHALLLQANQLAETVSGERRSQFTHALFDHTWSIFSPELWSFVATAAPSNLKALVTIGSDWLSALQERIADRRMLPFGLSLVALGLVWLARRFLLRRLHARIISYNAPGQLRRAVSGLFVTVSDTAAVALGCWLLYLGLDGSGLTPASVDPLIRSVLQAIVAVTLMRGLIVALLAPNTPQWRILAIPDQTAGPVARALTAAVGLVVAGWALGEVLEASGGDRATATALDAVINAGVALVLVRMLRRMRDGVDCEEQSLGPYIPAGGAATGVWRLGAWILAFLILAATAAGFIPLANFLINQTLWTLTLLAVLKLLLVMVDEGIDQAFGDNSRMSLAMQTTVGVRKRSLQQLGVVLAGVLRITLIALAALLALAPFGIQSTDFIGSVRNVFFGLSVAGFNISPVSILWGLALLVVGVIVTRAFQGWLQQKFLPATNLDSGLRNSITTATGYLGVFIVVAATLANFGLSLDRIAIVAGALSVGIGFGLQSIVNNFVSGLILLWDRSISVGDWIVVGTEQGYVKRISVRATEIQTFERASIIVPNSTLVSGTVKNWLRNNRTGRIAITVGTGFQKNPQVVADLLLKCANAHPDVLREPKPTVLFSNFTTTTQEYDLRCFSDVEAMSRIRSDLNYRIFAALTEAGIYATPGPALSEVRLLLPEDLQRAIGERAAPAGRTAGAATPGQPATNS